MKSAFLLLVFSAGVSLAQTPSVTEILNNYGLINAGTVAQGAIFIVKGNSLADLETTTLQSVPLQTTLRNVQIRITVSGTTTVAPLYYALKTQLAGILPSNTPVGTGTLVVSNNGRTSSSRPITVVKSAFGMLTLNGSGSGAAAVHNSSYVLLSSSNSTNPGDTVVFYGSGLGPTTAIETVEQSGANASGDLAAIPITIAIGGKNAQVVYHGRTIYPGLDQINVVIPTLDANVYGCNVAVVITTNSVIANGGSIPVAPSGAACPTTNSGGGNTGVSITQAEVDRWIAAGFYTAGGVGLGRATGYSIDPTNSNSTTVTKSDSVSASFTRISGADFPRLLRGDLPAAFNTYIPTVGSCIVFTGQIADPFPLITRVQLDAGPAVTASGPNGVQIAAKNHQQVGGITYSAPNVPNTYVNAGRYTFTGSGGADIGAFTGTMDVLPDLVVTNNPDEFKTLNRNSSVTVRWTGGDPATNVQVQGFSFPVNAQGIPGTLSGFLCLAKNTDGQFTVPASVLIQLPATTSYSSSGLTFLMRGSLAVAQASIGTRLTIPNTDYGTAANSWSWAYQPEFK